MKNYLTTIAKNIFEFFAKRKIELQMSGIILGLTFFGAGDSSWDIYWHSKWWVLTEAVMIFCVLHLGKRLHWSVSLAAISTLIPALCYFGFWGTRFKNYELIDIFAINKISAYVVISYLLMLYFFSAIKRKVLPFIGRLLGWVCLVNSLHVVIFSLFRKEIGFEASGIFGNASMNGCLIAGMFPFVYEILKFERPRAYVLYLLPLAAVAITGRAAPILTLCAAGLSQGLMVLTPYQRKRLYPSLVIFLVGVLGVAFGASSKGYFLDSSGRLDIWRMAFKWVLDGNIHFIWTGVGPGLSALLLPWLQQITHTNTCCGWWMWWHSDLLQLLWEQGIVGVLAYTPVIILTFFSALKSPILFPAVMAFMTMASVNYPVRTAMGAFLGGFIVLASIKQRQGDFLNDY